MPNIQAGAPVRGKGFNSVNIRFKSFDHFSRILGTAVAREEFMDWLLGEISPALRRGAPPPTPKKKKEVKLNGRQRIRSRTNRY